LILTDWRGWTGAGVPPWGAPHQGLTCL